MPGSGETRRPRAARPTTRRRVRRFRWLRLALPVAVLSLVAFLYWQPISSYLETRNALSRRQAEVAELQAERALLERRFEESTSLAALAREARRTGLVRPGEQLFIIKGIPAWRRGHAAAH